MKNIILIPFFFILLLLSCEKDTDENTGNVTFYTNAQFVLNCGSFDVEIYIDSSLVGILKKPFPFYETPECNSNSSETILTIEKPEGEYEFTAILTCCSETSKYLGDFKVKKNSCSLVYIDLTYSE
jgi:hypothetical protein